MGLNTTWNFFSPDPANTMYFHYHVYFENEQGEETKEPAEGYIPEEKNTIVTDGSRRRMLYAIRFLMLDEKRIPLLLVPWLCQKYAGASRIRLNWVVEKIPSLDEAVLQRSTGHELTRQQIDSRSLGFDCGQGQDEIAL